MVIIIKLFLDVSDIINKRYIIEKENLNQKLEDIFHRYQAILLTDPPFNIKDNM